MCVVTSSISRMGASKSDPGVLVKCTFPGLVGQSLRGLAVCRSTPAVPLPHLEPCVCTEDTFIFTVTLAADSAVQTGKRKHRAVK